MLYTYIRIHIYELEASYHNQTCSVNNDYLIENKSNKYYKHEKGRIKSCLS